MNKVAANIVKGMVGRLQGQGRRVQKGELSWLQKKIIKHQEDQLVKWYQFKNFRIGYRRPYELLHTYQDIFENEIYRFRTQASLPLIIDCGANIGLSVLYFKQQYPNARVIVFEPDDNNFSLLTQNCTANNLSGIELHKEAVWIHNGTISFDAKQSEGSHIAEDGQGGHTVACTRLLDLLNAHESIQFLKMDIEGAEYSVVKDAAPALHKVENFFLEYHGKAEETYKLAELFEILRSAGFAVYLKTAADNLVQPFVQKSTGAIYDVQLNLFCYRNP